MFQELGQYCKTFILLSVSLWNDLSDPVFDGVGLAGFKGWANAFSLVLLLAPFLSNTVFPFSSFILWVGIVALGSPSLALPTLNNDNYNYYNNLV